MRDHSEAPCRHCGRNYMLNSLGSHERRCALAPDIRAATATLLDDGTGDIVSRATYLEISKSNPKAVSLGGLTKQFGLWSNVATAFGLRFNPKAGIWKTKSRGAYTLDESDDFETIERRILEEDAIAAHSLPYYAKFQAYDGIHYLLR